MEEQIVYNAKEVEKRGTIEIIKKDADNPDIFLKDARFDLYRYNSAGQFSFRSFLMEHMML